MPTAYTTGTINQPDAGSVGLTMVERIRDDLAVHVAWDIVEEFTAASGTVRWYVLKCLGSANGLGSDFFLIIGRTLATGELRFALCEGYSSATHTMTYFGMRSIPVPQQMDVSGRIAPATTFVLGTTTFTGSGSQPSYHAWIPSGTSTKWWIIVADDSASIAFNGAANGFVHVGAYTPLDQLGNTFPIQIIGHSDADGLLTRNPAVANVLLNTYAYSLKFNGGGSSSMSYSVALGFEGPWQYNDKLQNMQRAVAEVGMIMMSYPGQQDWSTVYGFALGKQKRMRRSNQGMPGGFAFGDAFALSGTLWVPWLPTLGYIFDTGVASS